MDLKVGDIVQGPFHDWGVILSEPTYELTLNQNDREIYWVGFYFLDAQGRVRYWDYREQDTWMFS
jgi:hypothetical protein